MAFFKKRKKKEIYNYTPKEVNFLRNLGVDIDSDSDNIKEITYLTCLRILSESIGSIPLELIKKDEKKGGHKKADRKLIFDIINRKPNDFTTPSDFWGTVEINRIIHGNAYVFINKEMGVVKDLRILDSSLVTILVNDTNMQNLDTMYYKYQTTGGAIYIKSSYILHFKSLSLNNGLTGASLPELANAQIKGALSGQGYISKLNQNDMNGGKAIIEYTGDLDDSKRVQIAKKIEKNIKATETGKFIPIPVGMKVQKLEMNMADAQFLEISRMSAMQIAGLFGVRPSQINDNSQTYSNADVQIRDFFKNTLRGNLKKYTQELNNKLLTDFEYKQGYRFQFDTRELLENDLEKRIETYSKAIQNGIFTPQEVRDIEKLKKIEDVDILMVNGALDTIENIKNKEVKS